MFTEPLNPNPTSTL